VGIHGCGSGWRAIETTASWMACSVGPTRMRTEAESCRPGWCDPVLSPRSRTDAFAL
jgi:hypothetical protein